MSSFLVLREGDTRNRWRDRQVCPDVGQGIMALWARRLGRRKRRDERERSPGWKGREESVKEKGLVRDWSGKTMNASDVEKRI
ncbi:hypothetical protein TNCV_2384881 [Trichonephila clavipes]|nr:hypothetical protein TNCV_2384881 [Trichonephila clavipes]